MKVSELGREALNRWTAKAQGWKLDCTGRWLDDDQFKAWKIDYTPSTNWQQAGELVEKYEISLGKHGSLEIWAADLNPHNIGTLGKNWHGPTPQIAICRAVVASVYGDEVPEEV